MKQPVHSAQRTLRLFVTAGMLIALVLAGAAVFSILPSPAVPAAPVGFTETPTFTPLPPTDTPTSVPPTNTPTSVPPTNTPTSVPPTETPTPTPPTSTPPPPPPPPPPPQPTSTPLPVISDPYIIKSVNVEQAQPGEEIVFTIEVVNPNNVSLNNVVVGDQLSPLVEYISADVPRGALSFDSATNTWTLHLDSMAPGERLVFTIRTRVRSDVVPPNAVINTAVLTSSQGVTVSNTTNTLIVPLRLPQTGSR